MGNNLENWGPYVFTIVLVVIAIILMRWQMRKNIDSTIALDVPTAARQIQRIAELQKRLDENILENSRGKIKAQTELVSRLEIQAKEYNDRLSVLNASLKEAQTDIANMQQEMAKLKLVADQTPELLNKIDQLEKKVCCLEEENIKLEEKVLCLEHENEALRATVTELNVHLNVVLDENKLLRLENGKLQEAIKKVGKGF